MGNIWKSIVKNISVVSKILLDIFDIVEFREKFSANDVKVKKQIFTYGTGYVSISFLLFWPLNISIFLLSSLPLSLCFNM